ncbi:UNVERIFIED_CONTAM: hypothetical protein RMT77_003072 [Armadillidium vulgare]
MYGIVSDSPFNIIKSFCAVEGFPVDFDHDWCEGIIPYVLSEFITFAVKSNWFTLQYLNKMIVNCQYSEADFANKPSVVSSNINMFKIKQTSCQAWCFLRLLPFFIGDKVPVGNSKWEVILQLINVIENLTIRCVTKPHVFILATLLNSFYIHT